MMKIDEYQAKTLVNKSYATPFAWTEYTLNPYMGCWHDCMYCDGKAEKYHMHSDFAKTIKVKKNAAQLLEKFLNNKGYFISKNATNHLFSNDPDFFRRKAADFMLFFASGVCDPYQPVERNEKTTQQLLQVAYDYGIPVHLLTKNTLALRDIDLLKKINEQNYAGVHFSITLADDDLRKHFEPQTSSSQKRFDAVKQFRQLSIPSGIYFMPAMPFIGDTDENMRAIYSNAKEANASFVMCMGLTLKPGKNKNEFFSVLENHFPDLVDKYRILYGNNNPYGILDVKQMARLKLMRAEMKSFRYAMEYQLPYYVPRYYLEGRIKSNLQMAEILAIMSQLYDVFFNDYSISQSFRKAAHFFETFDKDIFSIQKEDIRLLPISRDIYPCLIDFYLNGKSTILKNLEKDAYNQALE